ncbi:MAG: hypothetical protein Q8J97_07715, partial [Flavobacteriaceae bacterium]|nr:hypothetical protein [Flavobacteriaceae bacterium]
NGDFLFLAPEYQAGSAGLFGAEFGALAIRKTNLELKYLKALHGDFNTTNPIDRQCFGIHYFNKYLAVQLVQSKKTVIINTNQVESWNNDLTIGAATVAVYKFQINGIDLVSSPNELVIDNTGIIHINTWELTSILKFSENEIIGIEKTPEIQTNLILTTGTTAVINGYIIDEGKSPITSGGFKYGTDPEALTNNLPADPFSYDFTEALTNLEPGIYYAKAYGINTEGIFYGNTVMFSIVEQFNAVSLLNTDTVALLQFIDTHYGCSIRCVQDAPGEATGTTGTATDQDGNIYDTVVINEKRWMVQNLKTKHFRNGDPIPNIIAAESWAIDETGAWAEYQ